MYKVFVTRRIPEEGINILSKACPGLEVYADDSPIPREELLSRLRGKDGMLCLLSEKIDRELMEAGGSLRVIANYAVGYDNIDVGEATRRGIIVTNTPGVLTEATAEMAWALLFSISRRVAEGDRLVRAKGFRGWEPMLLLGEGVSGKTLGIIGAGRIGQAMARMSMGFNMRVLYFSRSRKEGLEKELGAKKVGLDTLLRESDFVSLHVSLTQETYHLIGARELSLMKKTAYLINAARGPVVDEKALVEALKDKGIAGAGLDVYEEEPRLAPGLTELDNVVLAPHLGSATTETRRNMAVMAAENLVAGLRGETPENVVNPEVFKV
ncbi:MAG: 2-hydroxyacid dehydrogenase, partial [Candidatus Brocadiales bacterium]